MHFYHHPDFEKELAKFIKKHCRNNITLDTVLRHFQNLLTSYFEHNKPVFPNLRRGEGFKGHEVYFHRFIVPNCNLGKTQHPKCYFYRQEDFISILCSGTHIENYKEHELRNIALIRLNEILGYLGSNELLGKTGTELQE